jgi:putative sugar O-methyltransferase
MEFSRNSTHELHPQLKQYLKEMIHLKDEYTPSLFWENLLDRLRINPDSLAQVDCLTPSDFEAFIDIQGYGLKALPDGAKEATQLPDYQKSYEAARNFKAFWKSGAIKELSKEDLEHARALMFLEFSKANPFDFKEYLDFINNLKVCSSMQTARFFFYKKAIEALVEKYLGDEQPNYLEVGAGAGVLATFLAVSGKVRSYCIVDLPEMIPFSIYTIQRYVPNADIHYNEFPQKAEHIPPNSFWFIVPQKVNILPAQFFDVCLNFNSFMEMDEAVRNSYIHMIYRLARPGAIFYNVNRRQKALPQRDGSVFDNNPLLYPYRPDDEIIFWEEDAFQMAARNNINILPSLAIARAGIIK